MSQILSFRSLGAGLILLGAAIAPVSALAQDATEGSGSNVAEEAPAERGALADLDLASALHAYAKEAGDPLVAIAALRVAATVPTEEAAFEAETEAEADAGGGDGEAPATENAGDFDAMVATARDLAADNDSYQAMIDEVVASGTRDRVGGFATALKNLPGNTRATYRESFFGGRLAEVAIDGGGDGRMNLIVYDENGNRICLSNRAGDRQYCSWTPRWTGQFRVVVVNLDPYSNRYRVTMN